MVEFHLQNNTLYFPPIPDTSNPTKLEVSVRAIHYVSVRDNPARRRGGGERGANN